MKRKIQSYLVFTTGLYRLVLFLLLPLFLLGLELFLGSDNFFMIMYVFVTILLFAEIMLDNWSFGGIAARNNTQIEYLKSSKRGMELIQNGLIASMARQFLECGAVLALGGMIFGIQNKNAVIDVPPLLLGLNLLFLEYTLAVLAVTVARFFDGWMVNMGIAYAASLLLVGGIYLTAINLYVALPVFAVMALIVSVAGVKLTMGRVKESYYDKTA